MNKEFIQDIAPPDRMQRRCIDRYPEYESGTGTMGYYPCGKTGDILQTADRALQTMLRSPAARWRTHDFINQRRRKNICMKKALMIMYMAIAVSTAQAQSPLSFYAEAGIGTSRLYGKHSCCDTRIACKAGIGAKYALNKTWVLQSALEFVSIGGKDDMDYVKNAKMNELYLQIPIQNSCKVAIGKRLPCLAECRSVHCLRRGREDIRQHPVLSRRRFFQREPAFQDRYFRQRIGE